MPTRATVDSLRETIALLVDDTLSTEAQQQRIAVRARSLLADATAQNESATGRTVTHTTTVDGRLDAIEESVRPNGGVIEYEFDLVNDLFAWIGEQLVLHSPVGGAGDPHPGLYARSHAFFADGVEIQAGAPAPKNAGEYVFLSTVPYARKVERGQSPAAPDGVYQAVAALAARRFGNVARIVFSYMAPLGAGTALEEWASRTKQRRSHDSAADAHWNRRQPAITITLR